METKVKHVKQVKYYSLYPDETDARIAELEREVETLQKKLKNQNEVQHYDVEELQTSTILQKEIDLLEAALRRQKRKYTYLSEEADLLRTEVEMLNKALNRPALKEENLVEMMMQQMENRTDELHMSRTLIMELQNVAFSEYAEDKIIAQAKSVLYDNNYLKKKVMDMEVKLLKSERNMNEIRKHSDLVEKSHKNQLTVIAACKEKLKELSKEKESALEEMEKHFENKESQRLAQEKLKFNLFQVQINDLKARLHLTEVSGNRVSLPPLMPQSTDALLLSELRTDLENKNELISDLKLQLSDFGQRSEKSSSSIGKRMRQTKVKIAELTNRNKELEGEVNLLKSQMKQMTEMTTQEINDLREQKKRLASLLHHIEMDPENIETMKNKLEAQTQIFEKKMEQKEKGLEKLHATLRSMSKNLNENMDPQLVEQLTTQNRDLMKENERIIRNYNSEMLKRKKYYNLCEQLKGKIRVFVRVRPLLPMESEKSAELCVVPIDEYSLRLFLPSKVKEFLFDRVFQPKDDQATVFKEVSSLVQSAIDGYCVSIFGFGQTNAGKTYTLLGEGVSGGGREGIAPRTFKKIFDIFQEQGAQFKFSASMYIVELYNDQLIDLLKEEDSREKEPPLLEIKRDSKNMIYVRGAVVKEVKSADDMLKMYIKGISARHVSVTKMNAQSSRSHLIIGISIESINNATRQISKGKLSVIDLAGSERICTSTTSTEMLKEANSINLSLSALGDVISALMSEQTYVPFRNNKLTMLMQDSLGGNAKTLMIVNLSPANENSKETNYSLCYATRAKLIKNDPIRATESEQVSHLRKQVKSLKQQVAELKEQLLHAFQIPKNNLQSSSR